MIGSMLIIILGMVMVPTLGWRWMIRVSVAPSVILIFLFKVRHSSPICPQIPHTPVIITYLSVSLSVSQFIPESARYNVSAGNVLAAVETLQKIAQMNRTSLPAGRLKEPIVVSSP